jgi:hypothetical protein
MAREIMDSRLTVDSGGPIGYLEPSAPMTSAAEVPS